MTSLKKLAFALITLQLAACASINSVSLTPIPTNRSRQIRAEVSKTIFLAFSFDNDFVDPLVSQLKSQCPNGIVTGILTKDEVISYVIVFKHRIEATGFCSQAQAANNTPKRHTASEEEPSLEN